MNLTKLKGIKTSLPLNIAVMQIQKYPNGQPMLAQQAIQQGVHLAKNILRLINQEALKPFYYFDKRTMRWLLL